LAILSCSFKYTETQQTSSWKTVKADTFFKGKFTISVTYSLQQCSSHELQVKKTRVHYYKKLAREFNFLKAQESYFNIKYNFNNHLPIHFKPISYR